MSSALTQVIPTIHERVLKLYRDGARHIALKGSRRCGKSWYLGQREMSNMLNYGLNVNIATQTAEQGRLGMYADMVQIIDGTDGLERVTQVRQAPREIRCGYNQGVIHFSVYPNPERAKGIACDDVVINEANNFTLKQVQDIIANARDCVLFDYNQSPEWRAKVIPDEAVVKCIWQDNPYLTATQREYFDMLKRNAESPNATAVDIWLYETYYLGNDADVQGEIFTHANIRKSDELPACGHYLIFCDPSALRGNDYFACVLTATDGEKMYVVDMLSVNSGGMAARVDIVCMLRDWLRSYDVERLYVETNGEIGISFAEFAENSGLPVEGWYSRGSKFDRIMRNYTELTCNVEFCKTERTDDYLKQIYDFSERCEHDDNIDAVNSAWLAHKFNGTITTVGVWQ